MVATLWITVQEGIARFCTNLLTALITCQRMSGGLFRTLVVFHHEQRKWGRGEERRKRKKIEIKLNRWRCSVPYRLHTALWHRGRLSQSAQGLPSLRLPYIYIVQLQHPEDWNSQCTLGCFGVAIIPHTQIGTASPSDETIYINRGPPCVLYACTKIIIIRTLKNTIRKKCMHA